MFQNFQLNLNEHKNIHRIISLSFYLRVITFSSASLIWYCNENSSLLNVCFSKCLKRKKLSVKYKQPITALRYDETIAFVITNLFHMASVLIIVLSLFACKNISKRAILTSAFNLQEVVAYSTHILQEQSSSNWIHKNK